MGTALCPPDFGDTDGAMSEVAVRNVWIVHGMALPPKIVAVSGATANGRGHLRSKTLRPHVICDLRHMV